MKLAEKFNQDVILLGDIKNRKVCENWNDISVLTSEKFLDFEKIYIHLSPNNYDYELFCFQRYFILEEYMRQNHIGECIMLDSDVCTFVNYSELDFRKYDMAASCMYYQDKEKWMVVPHVTYWKLEQLQSFTDYLVEQYRNNSERLKNKRRELIEKNASYGISDMSLLYLWVMECCGNFWNLAIAQKQETFDVFFDSKVNCDGKSFKMIHGIKKVIFKKGIPYFVTEEDCLLKANVIHAQGDRKKYIHMITKRRYNIISLYWSEFKFYVKKTSERGKRFISRYI